MGIREQVGVGHRDVRLDPSRRRVVRGGRDVALTSREFEILRLLMQDPGRLVTRSAISRAVWARSATSAKNVLDVHMSSLRKKLGADYIETIRGEGFRLADRGSRSGDVAQLDIAREADAQDIVSTTIYWLA